MHNTTTICGFILNSCKCEHVAIVPWRLCLVQRLPTLASWPLFHPVFLCPSSPLSLPTKQRSRTVSHEREKKHDYNSTKSVFHWPLFVALLWLCLSRALSLNTSSTTCSNQSRKSMLLSSQSGTKSLPVVIWFTRFSRAWHWLHGCTSGLF